MWGGGLMLGRGIIGGAINDPRQQGRALAEMAQQVLNGATPQEIGILPGSRFSPHFDYAVLKRFALEREALPPDSTVINHEPSYFELHREVIITSAVVMAILSSIIVVLSVNVRRRILAERHLTLLKQSLEDKVKQQTEALRARNKKLEELSHSMTQLAHTDALTGLPNRRALNELLKSAITGIKGSDQSHAVVVIDIDNFKTINDIYGHDVGDEVLIVVARTMRSALRPQDVIGRWGGEEFLAILDETDPRLAYAPCERMRKSVELIDQFDFGITISLGIAEVDGYSDRTVVLKKADQMMYRAKQRGKNQTYLE
jgi:diguanylate cyclase (GGDEF)-like protein